MNGLDQRASWSKQRRNRFDPRALLLKVWTSKKCRISNSTSRHFKSEPANDWHMHIKVWEALAKTKRKRKISQKREGGVDCPNQILPELLHLILDVTCKTWSFFPTLIKSAKLAKNEQIWWRTRHIGEDLVSLTGQGSLAKAEDSYLGTLCTRF